MQALFQIDLRGPDGATEIGSSLAEICGIEADAEDGDNEGDQGNSTGQILKSAEREVVEFAERVVKGTLQHREDIDKKLQGVTRNWDLRRMAIVDRNVLRMAVYELMFCPDVPPKVVINEAIEIGKKFSTANSGGFVNGILDRIRIDLNQNKATQKAAKTQEQSAAEGGPKHAEGDAAAADS